MLKEQKAKMFVIMLYVVCIDISVFLRTWAVKYLISVFIFIHVFKLTASLLIFLIETESLDFNLHFLV